MMSRVLSAAALAAFLVATPRAARADAGDVCLSAPVEGQKLQKAGRLLQARERFATCASQSCPTIIIHDCGRWLHEVDEVLPSILVVARDGSGRDVVDVTVSVDGLPPVPVTAHAISLDPGQHKLRFARPGMPAINQDILLRESEKNRSVTITFGAREAHAPPGERPVPVATWILGGISAAAFGTAAVFGALGLGQRTADHCATGCSASERDSTLAKFHVADVSLAVGVVALGAALYFYFSRPAVERRVAQR
jgi:hypothetical protein